jgi:rubrerythrin
MPQKHAFTMVILVLVHVLMGIATAGTNIAASNIALKLAPKGRATAYLAANSVISSLGLGLVPLLGGFLADLFALRGFSLVMRWHAPSREFSLYTISFEHWDFLFFLSFLMILYELHRLSRVRGGDAVENRAVLRDVFNEVRRTARSFSTIGGVQQAFPYPAALSQGSEERLNSNDNDLSEGEVMAVKREMTKKFLEDAFAGESMAHMRYAIFAEKAEKEGLKNTSNLFRAVSFAELVHARNHYNALGHLKDTPDNLQTCIDGEHFENTEMYPVYNNTAKLQEESEAQISTHYALEAEKIHEKLYTEAKKIAEQKKDVDYKKVYICPVCGYTVIGEAPDKCPVCGAPKEKFRLFEA